MATPRRVAVVAEEEEAEAVAEGTQLTAPPSMDLSPDDHSSVASQVLGFSSLPPSPPSVPPDIRNWFSSYEYESPGLSGLPFDLELGSSVADSAGFEKIQELRRGEAREWSHSPSPERPTESPDFEHLPIFKGTHEKSCSFNDGRPDQDRSNYNQIQTQRGRSPPKVGFTAIGGDQRALNGSEGLVNSECDNGDKGSVLQPAMGTEIKHHEQPKQSTSAGISHEHEHLVGRTIESPQLFQLGSYNSEATSADGRRQEGDHATAGDPTPTLHRRDSKEAAGAGSPAGSWVSTKGGRRRSDDSDGNLRKGDSMLKSRRRLHVEGHGPTATRTALADRTNHPNRSAEEAPEIAGKWRCPRRNKPERGPPLKQLRLETWVRRVV